MYLVHPFNLCTLASGWFGKANGSPPAATAAREPRTVEGARCSSQASFHLLSFHQQSLGKVRCLPQTSYWPAFSQRT